MPRRVIKTRRYFSSTTVVEVYPLLLHVQTTAPDSESKTLRIRCVCSRWRTWCSGSGHGAPVTASGAFGSEA